MHQVKTSLTRSTVKIVRRMEKRQLLQQQSSGRSLRNTVLLCACVLTGCLLILGSAVGDDPATASERAMLESSYESLSLPEELRDEGMEGRLKSFKGIRRHLPWSKGLVSVGRELCHNFWADYIVAEVGTPPVDWVDPYTVPAGSTTDTLYPLKLMRLLRRLRPMLRLPFRSRLAPMLPMFLRKTMLISVMRSVMLLRSSSMASASKVGITMDRGALATMPPMHLSTPLL